MRVEVDVGRGPARLSVVGLLETAVKESKDRVRAALANCGYEFPAGRVTVNRRRPTPKEGGRFDCPSRWASSSRRSRSRRSPRGRSSPANCHWAVSCAACAACCPRQAARAATADRADANGREAALGRRARVVAAHLHEVCAHAAGQQALAIEAQGAAPAQATRFTVPTSPMCAGRRHVARWRSPRRAGTACCYRSARHRQEHAGAAPARACSRPRRGRSARDGGDPLAVAARLPARRLAAATVPRAASHRLGRRARRWRLAPAPRRDFAGAQRRAVPRRAAGVDRSVLEVLREPLESRHIVSRARRGRRSSRRGSSWSPR